MPSIMGLPGSLRMLLLSVWFFCSLTVLESLELSTSSTSDARELDALLQDHAYQAFARPRTGVVYQGVVPSNLTGIQVSAMRLRSGSLKTRGVSMYQEFVIPVGVVEQPYVERLVLVYQNLGNWSMTYYPPLQGYMYLAPVLGLLAYDASDLMAKNLPELDIQASGEPISIKFSSITRVPDGLVAKCVSFDLNGSVNLSNALAGNICTTFKQGHFSIVAESIAPSSPPIPMAPPRSPPPPPPPPPNDEKNKSKVWKIVGSVVGGIALLVVLGGLVVWGRKYKQRKEMNQMERAADVGEALHMTTVGTTKAPAATGTRTQPALETEYMP
ncbi:hypothetical protein ABFS82_10G001100 [Erythranthe guttata]|nr:PREDICTED: uncharacterized protein LOC105953218 [Erythranthe guttata]|eukprot:XP_012832316.1 PREDICTED: uncharacterized protein LOC105953218 [Erythranthe guttata]